MAVPNFTPTSHLSSVKSEDFVGLEGLLPARLKEFKPPHLKLVVDAGEVIPHTIKPTVQLPVSHAPNPARVPAPSTASAKPMAKPASRPQTDKVYAYQTLGNTLFTSDRNPFDESEDVVFEHLIESRFYETADEAMAALRKLVSSTRVNFAYQVEIVSRYFHIADYRYRKYAFKARVGVYLKTQWKADKAMCERQLEELKDSALPLVEARLEKQLSIHDTARKIDLLPNKEFTEGHYTLMSLAAFGTLCVTLYGMFSGWLA